MKPVPEPTLLLWFIAMCLVMSLTSLLTWWFLDLRVPVLAFGIIWAGFFVVLAVLYLRRNKS